MGSFRSRAPRKQPGGLEEERRLCYVGLTRARDKLYVTWAQTRRRGGELRHSIRSKLLDAIPPEVVEEQRSSLVFSVGRQSGGMTAGRYSGWGRQRARDDDPTSRSCRLRVAGRVGAGAAPPKRRRRTRRAT